jgi:hypothetical protein
MTEAQQAYQIYLESEHWRLLRAAAFRQFGRKCSRCPATCRLQVHHVRYRWPWTASTTGDLVILCRSCHEKEHGIRSVPQPVVRWSKRARKKLRQLRWWKRQNEQSERFLAQPERPKAQPPKRRKPKRVKDKGKWWPGMYEKKLPGEFRKEVGTGKSLRVELRKTPDSMNPRINRHF